MTTPPGGDQPPYDPNQPQQPDPNQWSGQPGYQQPGYQQGYPQGYPQYAPPPQGAYGYQVPDHPKATTAMVLGILGVVACQILGPFAWSMGKRTVAEIDAAHGQLGGRGQAQAGYILGIVGTVLLGLSLAFIVVYFVIIVAIIGGTAASNA